MNEEKATKSGGKLENSFLDLRIPKLSLRRRLICPTTTTNSIPVKISTKVTHVLYVNSIGRLVVTTAFETQGVLSGRHIHLDLAVDG